MIPFCQRTLSGILFVLLVAGGVLLSSVSFLLLLLLIHFFGMLELNRLAVQPGRTLWLVWGLLAGSLALAGIFAVSAGLMTAQWLYLLPAFVTVPLAFPLFRADDPFGSLGTLLLSWGYITLPLALLVLTGFERGEYYPWLTLLPFLLIWVNDTMAFLVGSTLGKHPLLERISPHKTWEGALGGGLFSAIAGGLLSQTVSILTFYDGLAIGFIVGTCGIVGDLLQSLLKRHAGIKDSGQVLPGHGGVLDRFDGFLFALPFVFTYLALCG